MRSAASLLVAVVIALGACSEDHTRPADDTTPLADTSLDADTHDVDTSPPDTAPLDTGPDVADTADAHDTVEVVDTGYDPFTELRTRYLPEDAAAPEPYTCVGLVNANAEANSVAGWTVTRGEFKAQDETGIFGGNYPAAHEGEYYFRAGDTRNSRMEQRVDVRDALRLADRNATVTAVLGAFIRTHDGEDEAYIDIAALDENGTELDGRDNGPFLKKAWRARQVALRVPPATSEIRIGLRGVRNDGDSNDAYFDAITLCLYNEAPQPTHNDAPSPPYLMSVLPDRVTVLFETFGAHRATIDYGPTEALGMSVTEPAATRMHQIVLPGLTPGARHYYRVSYGDLAYPVWDFRAAAAPESEERVEFVMFADNQDGPEHFTILAEQMAALDPDFMLHGGDCVQNSVRSDYRERLFQPMYGLANKAGLVIGAGNHETYSFAVITSPAAREMWELYTEQPGDGHCFGWRWGPLFVMVIDTERPHMWESPQYRCIEAALASDLAQTAQFRTALFHRAPLIEFWDPIPPFSPNTTFYTAEMDAEDVRADLAPLFESARMDLVFNGHNHLYQYTPRYPRTVSWVTSGGGGGGLEPDNESNRVADWSDYVDTTLFGHFHHLHVAIERGVMGVRAVDIDGDIIHEFRLEAE